MSDPRSGPTTAAAAARLILTGAVVTLTAICAAPPKAHASCPFGAFPKSQNVQPRRSPQSEPQRSRRTVAVEVEGRQSKKSRKTVAVGMDGRQSKKKGQAQRAQSAETREQCLERCRTEYLPDVEKVRQCISLRCG